MNWERVEGNWKDFQGKVLQQWSKLTNDDLHQVKGRRDALLGILQARYGIARQAAEHQLEDWMRTVGEQTGRRQMKDPRACRTPMNIGSSA